VSLLGDRTIVEMNSHAWLPASLSALQWHPEEIDDLPWVRRLFEGFARAAKQ